ncbi:hypothetical protein DJ526_09895, partial [Sulfolobus sp. A20-N-G8]
MGDSLMNPLLRVSVYPNFQFNATLQFKQNTGIHAKKEYLMLNKDLRLLCTAKTLINSHKSNLSRDVEVLPSIESSVIDALGGERIKEKHCRGLLCGKPDMLYEGKPAEIKSFNIGKLDGKSSNYWNYRWYRDIFEKGIAQAGIYAWINEANPWTNTSKNNLKYSYLIIALYKDVDEYNAVIKEIDMYIVDVLSSPTEDEVNDCCE